MAIGSPYLQLEAEPPEHLMVGVHLVRPTAQPILAISPIVRSISLISTISLISLISPIVRPTAGRALSKGGAPVRPSTPSTLLIRSHAPVERTCLAAHELRREIVRLHRVLDACDKLGACVEGHAAEKQKGT